MRRIWNWLKAEWAITQKQLDCPHTKRQHTHDECPDCGDCPEMRGV